MSVLTEQAKLAPQTLFSRVLVGVDSSEESREAGRQGAAPALVAASADADLLVVGSRGLHGLKALGSVSERVAHQARSSVLIVREHMAANRRGDGL